MYIKYTLGVPLMETPFFFLAHIVALVSAYEANGWSTPYLLIVGLSTIFYLILGFHLLMKVLVRYFSMQVVSLVVLSLLLATNLFYHATYVTMAHSFLFFDGCLLIYLSDRFYERSNNWLALVIGMTVGLIALTRVPEVISVLIPLSWGITSIASLKERLSFFVKNWQYLLLAAGGFLIVFSLQLAYWFYVSGDLIFNPYQGEGFNFLKPNILKGWFHFSNGWLIYTPIMAFSLLGYFFLPKYAAKAMLPIFLFVGLNTYIHYCYYVWTYFPGFGQRPMVESYPLLAFGLAAFYAFFSRTKLGSWFLYVALVFFSVLNLFQTWQMKKGVIWSERGNAAFYWETFGTMTSTLESLVAYETNIRQPDTTQLGLVNVLAYEGFEDTTAFPVSKEIVRSGSYSMFDANEFAALKTRVHMGEGIFPNDWIAVELHAYMKQEHRIWNRDACSMITLEILDEKGQKVKGEA